MLQNAVREYEALSGEKCGFALMLFSFDGPEFTWISNAQRADMVKTMQEFIRRIHRVAVPWFAILYPPDQVSADRN